MSKEAEALEALTAILDDNGENPLVEDRWKVNFFDNHWRTIRAALTPRPVEESEWLTSEPHTEYEMLKRQFNSMRTLINSMGREISYYSKKSYETGEKHLAELTASLESERAMNAQLTEELERALAPQPVDMSSLRKEIFLHDDFSLTMQAREAVYWVLDHLAARGLIAAKPEPIEGLSEACRMYPHFRTPEQTKAIEEAARRYLDMIGD